MLINEQDYCKACAEFIKVSDQLHDGWELKQYPGLSCPVLQKKFTKYIKSETPDELNEVEMMAGEVATNLDAEDDEVSDDMVSGVCQFECHVIYKEAYSNPVLYFQPSGLDGQVLSLENCWQQVEGSHRNYVVDASLKWSFLTQVQHPVFNTPYFQLHPCHTADFLEPLKHSSNYIMSWLSIVIPVFNLSFSPEEYEPHFKKLNQS